MADRIILMLVVTLAAWAGVATKRWQTGKSIWDRVTILYALLAAALTMFVLRRFGIAP